MKHLVLILSIVTFSIVYSQTKEIAHKSHSGSSQNFVDKDYSDNFGLNEDAFFQIEKVKYLNEKCVVVYGINYVKQKKIDTLCDHPNFSGQYTFDQIKTFYPENTYFEGFEGKFFNDSIKKPIKKTSPKKNTFNWLVVLVFLGAGTIYVFKPVKKS